MNQPTPPPPTQSTGINLHQQKLFALIAAGVAFVGMILPWSVQSLGAFGGGSSSNGFGGWGLLSLFGIVGVIFASLMEDKSSPYSANMKMVAMCSFGGVVLGAFILFMQLTGSRGPMGVGVKTGIGVWICLIAGVLGLLLASGVIKPPPKSMSSPTSPSTPPSTPSSPPPPPPR